MLAHVNTAGLHIPLWIVAQDPASAGGRIPSSRTRRAAFFGNVFTLGAHGTDPTKMPMYYCTGAKYNVNPPQGRVGWAQTSPPYVNAFGSTYASCSGGVTLRRRGLPEQDRRLQGLQRLEQRRHRLAAEHRVHDDHVERHQRRHAVSGYRWR